MLIVPIENTYSQTLNVQLAGQQLRLNLYQKSTGFYCDVYKSDALVIGGVLCRNHTLIVRNKYLGLIGDLSFIDTQGASDPSSPGLGSRFLLYYMETSDLGAYG